MARILVIDDEKDVRVVIRAMLESGGHEVEVAADGEEGIRKFQQGPYDLVLCDSVMPRKPGEETTRVIRKLSKSVVIISMTAATFDDDEYSAKSEGISRRIAKPFRFAELLSLVAECLSERRT